MKKVKVLSLAVLTALGAMSCSDKDTVNGKVTLGFGASSTAASTSNARTMSAVVFEDFKLNIKEIEFEFAESDFDDDDAAASTTPQIFTDDIKLKGPFIVDLLDPDGTFVKNTLATVDVPNAVYEEVEFKFDKNNDPASGDMYGKSVLITGKISEVPFVFWHDTDEEIEIDFENAAQNLVVDGNALAITIQMKLDQLLEVNSGINWSEARDGNGDGIIEISPKDEDGNNKLADIIKDKLEDITDLEDDKDDDKD